MSRTHRSFFFVFTPDAAGFYCPVGALTSDPFRNDTTLRPYPCSPGSYCLGGVGFSEIRSGDYLYAQTCPAGFFCETARYVTGIEWEVCRRRCRTLRVVKFVGGLCCPTHSSTSLVPTTHGSSGIDRTTGTTPPQRRPHAKASVVR